MKSPAKKLFVVLSVGLPLAFAIALTTHAEEGSSTSTSPSTTGVSTSSATTNSEALCSGEDKATVKQKCAAQNGDLRVTKTSAGCYDVQCVSKPPPTSGTMTMPMCAGSTDDITCATGTHRERVKTPNNCFDVQCVPMPQTNGDKPMTKPPLKPTEDGDVITFMCKGTRSTGEVVCDINGKSFSFNMNAVRNMQAKMTVVKPKPPLNDKCMAIAQKINAMGTSKNEDGTASPELEALRKEYIACRGSASNGVVRGSVGTVESDRNVRLMKDGNCWYKVNDKTGTKEQVSCGEKPNTITATVKPTSSSTNAQ